MAYKNMNLYLYILLVFPVLSVDSKFFRNDYSAHSSINGWIKYHPFPATWEDADLRCFYEGSILASPINDELLNIMKSTITQSGPVLTGFSSNHFNGVYHSAEGVSIEEITATWVPNEPNNYRHENCIAMYSNGSLANVACNMSLPYICYRKDSAKTLAINACGTTDPEYVFEGNLGKCYKVHTSGQTWPRALMACAAEGGHLAIINSEMEAKHLKELINKYPVDKIISSYRQFRYFFIGYHDRHQHRIFVTIHGESLPEAGYNIWAVGEPNNNYYPTGEYCGAISLDAKLNDISCEDIYNPFVCEMQPGTLLDTDVNSEEYQPHELGTNTQLE